MNTRVSIILAAAALALPATAVAAAADHSGHGAPAATPAAKAAPSPALSEGEVRRIDKAANTVTLKHGPIANLGMPGMTMSFPVMQSGALDKLKVGDKVKFVAEDRSGNTVITKIEPVR
jgi:Cu/Ag efflux protein CusF